MNYAGAFVLLYLIGITLQVGLVQSIPPYSLGLFCLHWGNCMWVIMMTSSNGNIVHVTGPLCGEFTGEFPSQRPVMWSFDNFCAWIKGWVNNREAGDLRRYRAHYDIIVMIFHVTGPLCGEFTGEFPSQRPVMWSFDVFCAWIKGWVNNREAGDLRHHQAHYAVIVIMLPRRMWGKSNGYKPQQNTRCFYNTINFFRNPHNRHPIAHLWGQNMGCFLWVQNLIYVLLLLLHCYIYHGILYHIIKAFDCTTNWEMWSYFLAWAVFVCFLL